MAVFADVASPSSAAPLPARMAGKIAQVWKAWRNRREFTRLGEMSDAELADIGLKRADLFVAVDLPLGADPTAHLNTVAAARIRAIGDGGRLAA